MRLVRTLLDLLYPPKCPFCGRILERGEDGVCAVCLEGLPWAEGEPAVEGCETCLSPLWYQDGVREGVHRYKFGGGRVHARLFGDLMAQCLRDRWDGPVDLVTWAPLHPKRRAGRGYDQAELLARRVGEAAGLPVASTLEKRRNTGAQSQLRDAAERAANAAGAYRALPGLDLAGSRVVLVDDVVTTGATLAQCAACLRDAGAASVVGLTFAQAGVPFAREKKFCSAAIDSQGSLERKQKPKAHNFRKARDFYGRNYPAQTGGNGAQGPEPPGV